MPKTAMILAPGLEEVEALTVVDLLRRAGIECRMLSLDGTEAVTGSHGIAVQADGAFPSRDLNELDGLILPGGMPGATNLAQSEALLDALRRFSSAGKLTAAICAAPTVLAKAGLLKGVRACCYPSREAELAEAGALVSRESAVRDGTIVTSRGMGTAVDFGLHLVEYFQGEEKARELARAIVWEH